MKFQENIYWMSGLKKNRFYALEEAKRSIKKTFAPMEKSTRRNGIEDEFLTFFSCEDFFPPL